MISLSLAWFYLLALLSSNIVWWPSGVSQYLRNCGVSNCFSISTVSSYCFDCMQSDSSNNAVAPNVVITNTIAPNVVVSKAVALYKLAPKIALCSFSNVVSLTWIFLKCFSLIRFLLQQLFPYQSPRGITFIS